MKIFDQTFQVLHRALDVRMMRHRQLANNVANVDTPAYRPGDVDFEATLDRLVALDRHAQTTSGEVSDDGVEDAQVMIRGAEAAPTGDGNTVDLDQTMVALAENRLLFEATTNITKKRLAMLRYVITDGLG